MTTGHARTARSNELSETSRQRLASGNVLRIQDSKDEADIIACKQAPTLIEFATASSRDRFERVTSGLDMLHIPYAIDNRLVRGLDY